MVFGNGGVRQSGDLMLKRGMSQIGAVQLTARDSRKRSG